MTLETLMTLLADVPPVNLQALARLREPTASDVGRLSAAVLELSAYTQRCQACSAQLRTLAPVPLALPLVEWVL